MILIYTYTIMMYIVHLIKSQAFFENMSGYSYTHL